MKKIFGFYTGTPLVLRILVGLLIGVVLGLFVKDLAPVAMLGDIFVGALKAIAPVLVFVLVIASLSRAGNGIGKRFRTVIFFYILSTFLAAVVAVVASYIFPVTITLSGTADNAAPAGLWDVLRALLSNMVANPVTAIANGNYTGILL